MSAKMTCPACGAHLSAVREAFRQECPCPECGLSYEAATEIMAIQESRADEKLRAILSDAIVRRDAAETKAARLERQLSCIREVLDKPDEEGGWTP